MQTAGNPDSFIDPPNEEGTETADEWLFLIDGLSFIDPPNEEGTETALIAAEVAKLAAFIDPPNEEGTETGSKNSTSPAPIAAFHRPAQRRGH